MSIQDRELVCGDCRKTFVFSAAERQSFLDQGFHSPPGRCPACRAARKARNPHAGPSPTPRRELHDAVCSACQKATQVPFVPSASRPVYCRDCFSRRPVRV